MNNKKIRLMALFLPIFFELLFTMLTGVVDTFMLASEGDAAVGAVGTANTYISVFLVTFTIISSGMLAVMTQYIGAERPDVAQQTLRLGLRINLAVGLTITVLLCFFANPILDAVGIARDLRETAKIYMQTVGAFSVCSALIPIYNGYLRAFGDTSTAMKATVFANITNIVLNGVFLFGFGMGVFGIALATGISRLLNLIWVWAVSNKLRRNYHGEKPLKNWVLLRKILQVGLPGAMESVLYNLSVMIVISMLNRMDSDGTQAIARAYAAQIANFSFCAGCALAQANGIVVGWRIGAGELDVCDRETKKCGVIGIALGGVTAALFAVFSDPILSVFTGDEEMLALVGVILIVEIALEIGRAVNMVFGFALKASGDATYPMIIGIVFMFLCGVGGTWYFGMYLGWLAVGAYVGMAADECVRALLMYRRWQKGIWRRKNLLSEA